MRAKLLLMRVLTPTDTEILVMFCNTWAQLQRLEHEELTCDVLVEDDRHMLKKNPVFTTIKDFKSMCKDLLIQLGCTPRSRKVMGIHGIAENKKESENDFFKFFPEEEQKRILEREAEEAKIMEGLDLDI